MSNGSPIFTPPQPVPAPRRRHAPTTNVTEQRIHKAGLHGTHIAEKLIEILDRGNGRAGKTHPILARQATRTDAWYEEPTFAKAVEIKCTTTSKICPKCDAIEATHRRSGCDCTDPFIPTHKNCHQRFHEARGKALHLALSDHWRGPTPWAFHFLYLDYADEGSPNAHVDFITQMERAKKWYGLDIRVRVYTHIPRQTDLTDIANWIRTP